LTSVPSDTALDAEDPRHVVSDREARMLRFDDVADAERAHHFADLDRWDVAAAGVHPGAHRGVDRQVVDVNDEVPLGGNGSGLLDDRPVARLQHLGRSGGESALDVCGSHEAVS
jgi:hypothetical protein